MNHGLNNNVLLMNIIEILQSLDIDGSTLHHMLHSDFEKLIDYIVLVNHEVYKSKYVFREIILQNLFEICPEIRNPYGYINWIAPIGYVDALKLIPQPEQRSPEWYAFRKERLTASDIGTVLGKNPYAKPDDVLLKKCGYEKPFWMSEACAHGVKYEPIATQLYESRMNTTVHEFGCIPHPKYTFIGASPDGICSNGIMLEIKNPFSRKIVGIPPIQYWIQMQIQLEVCDLELCDFLECTYKKYSSYAELVEGEKDATHGNDEFGVVIEYYTTAAPKEAMYEYGPLNASAEDKKDWVTRKLIEIKNAGYVYEPFIQWWALKEYSLVRIRRDTAWFREALPKLKEFWDKVLKQREIGIESILPAVRKKKPSVCLLLQDEDDSNKKEMENEKSHILRL